MLGLYPNGTRAILTGEQIVTCNPEAWLKVLEIISRVCGPAREHIHRTTCIVDRLWEFNNNRTRRHVLVKTEEQGRMTSWLRKSFRAAESPLLVYTYHQSTLQYTVLRNKLFALLVNGDLLANVY